MTKPMTIKRLKEIEALVKMPCDGSRLYEHIAANRDLVAECKRLKGEIKALRNPKEKHVVHYYGD